MYNYPADWNDECIPYKECNQTMLDPQMEATIIKRPGSLSANDIFDDEDTLE